MNIIDELNQRVARGQASDDALMQATSQTVAEFDADTTAPDLPRDEEDEESLEALLFHAVDDYLYCSASNEYPRGYSNAHHLESVRRAFLAVVDSG